MCNFATMYVALWIDLNLLNGIKPLKGLAEIAQPIRFLGFYHEMILCFDRKEGIAD